MMAVRQPVELPPPGEIVATTRRASKMLRLLSNQQRLMILCRLAAGECPVGTLVDYCGLSQSSVSQHLARLRTAGLVETRREGTTVFYSLAGPEVADMVGGLCAIFNRRPRPEGADA